MMAATVYILCALTSIGCAVMLFRANSRNPSGLLLWTTVCFAMLAFNNVLLFLDLVVVPDVDLSLVRVLTALAGAAALAFGLIREST